MSCHVVRSLNAAREIELSIIRWCRPHELSVGHAITEGVRELSNERDSPDDSHPVSAEPSATGTVGSNPPRTFLAP